jgi:hypothetical protein
MADRNERTYEAEILDDNPGVRAAVSQSEEFREWRKALPTVDVDQETYYVRGGDMLKDEDQIMLEWVRRVRPGMLPSEESP